MYLESKNFFDLPFAIIAGADPAVDRPGRPLLLLLARPHRVGLWRPPAAAGTHRRLRPVPGHDRQARGQGEEQAGFKPKLISSWTGRNLDTYHVSHRLIGQVLR